MVTLPMFLKSEGARDIGTTSFQKNLMYLKHRFLKSAMKNGERGLCSTKVIFTLCKVVQQTREGEHPLYLPIGGLRPSVVTNDYWGPSGCRCQ